MENLGRFLPADYRVVGMQTLEECGCFRRFHVYVEGHHPELHHYGKLEFIIGLTGPETQITRCAIRALAVFEVLPELAMPAAA